VGESWAARYDRLHLHTPRVQSALPGLRMPRHLGRWVRRTTWPRPCAGTPTTTGCSPASAAPRTGVVTQMRTTGVTPTIDVGLIEALRNGRVSPVAALTGFDGGAAAPADGSRLAPDAVIAATGYTTRLTPVIGHLDVLDERGRPAVRGGRTRPTAPGLRFVGLSNPLKGLLFQIGLDARAAARAVATDLRSSDARVA
jgi:hypothetical protein